MKEPTYCGQVWFEMDSSDQVAIIQANDGNVKVLTCSCQPGQDCQAK